MIGRATVTALAVVVATLAACSTPRPPSQFEIDFDEETKPWTEIVTQLPPAPRAQDLVDISVSGGTQYRFSVDGSTLALGSDGVIRYVLVATSPEGARNVSYEGVRCATVEKKLYATGRADGTWVRSRTSEWSRIEEVGNNRQQAALMKEYLCPDGVTPIDLVEIRRRLRVTLPSTVL